MAYYRQGRPARSDARDVSIEPERPLSQPSRPDNTVIPRGRSTARARIRFAIFVSATYVMPPILVLLNIIPYRYRFWLLGLATAIIAVYVWLRHHGLAELGFRKDTLRASLRYNLWATLAGLLIIAALYFSGVLPLHAEPRWTWFFPFYMMVSCPAQEFLFRSVIFAEMDSAEITRRGWQVGLSSILYCFPHVVYRSATTLCLVFVAGLVWGYGFSRNRNFWGVAASHCVLGTVAVLAGLI